MLDFTGFNRKSSVDAHDPVSDFERCATADLRLRLDGLHRSLREAVARQSVNSQPGPDAESAPLFVTPDDAGRLLSAVERATEESPQVGGLSESTPAEERQRSELTKKVTRSQSELPIECLRREHELSDFEIDVLVLCAAAELDRHYGRLYGYVLDDMNRQAPCVELFCVLGNPGLNERIARQALLGRNGKLRRYRLLEATRDSARPERTQLALADGVLEQMTRPGTWRDRFFDPCEIEIPEYASLSMFPERKKLFRLAGALREGTVAIGAVWGERSCGVSDAVLGLAATGALPVHRLPLDRDAIDTELSAAKARKALLWIETDRLADPQSTTPEVEALLVDRLERVTTPVCLSGQFPWRPPSLLARRDFGEIRLRSPSPEYRECMWRRQFESLDPDHARDAIARFRLSPDETRAVGRVAAVRTELESGTSPADHIDVACRQVTQWQGLRFARLVEPKRGPDDLILPDALHEQVLEVARFFRSLIKVDDGWGFGRLDSGGGGIKVLFTGDSGTGKTLAAEVIAGQLGLDLLKVDLSQIVSKWVGETEKNLEIVFREAEASNTLLFFDEADTLFGKRGEIRGGNDRYANLEVGFLLQRLEQFSGLAVLASNLRDEIDPAFTRRFQIVLHFPRPKEDERRSLWRMAFPPAAPLSPGVDLDAFVKLDMTGASIVGAARMAALLAADDDSEAITLEHVQEGIRRQYRHEARVLSATAFETDPQPGARRR